MTIAVAHFDSDRGRAALRYAAEEAQFRGQPLVVLRIIAGVDQVTEEDPAVLEQVGAELSDYADISWTCAPPPRASTPPKPCSTSPRTSTPRYW